MRREARSPRFPTFSRLLSRTHRVSAGMREFFKARGIEPQATGMAGDDPLIDTDPSGSAAADAGEAERQSASQRLSLMNIAERMKAAMKGTKEERAVLIRDPNKLVSVSVLSSPKVTESEIEGFAKLGTSRKRSCGSSA